MMEAAFRVCAVPQFSAGWSEPPTASVGNPASNAQRGRSERRRAAHRVRAASPAPAPDHPADPKGDKSSADPCFHARLPAAER
jgi:hypothetical protein